MVLTWIYDLDLTLYSYPGSLENFDYHQMEFDRELKRKIQRLPGKKVLFTNGNLLHTLACIKKMKLQNTFHKVSCRELTGFKPAMTAYLNLYDVANINLNDYCYFFEDTIDNLKPAKELGWTTVYIGKEPQIIELITKSIVGYVDYHFPDISSALEYFRQDFQV